MILAISISKSNNLNYLNTLIKICDLITSQSLNTLANELTFAKIYILISSEVLFLNNLMKKKEFNLILKDISMVLADTSRSRFYLQSLIYCNMIPSSIVLLKDEDRKNMPGQIKKKILAMNHFTI